jgi:rhamnogalacturonyl hydrolase YesR
MLESVLKKLEYFIQAGAWRGYDPYDGLNSKFLRFLTFNRKWLRIAVIQFMKRSPINLRPFFGVAKSRNPKVMGLLAKAYLVQYKKTKKQEYLDKARKILDWLIANSAGYSGYSWGYNFNWQSAVFYIPKGIPTVVNTSFIANAFLDAYKITKEKNYLDIARSSCDFILNDLNRTESKSQIAKGNSAFCFSYSPLDTTCCYNANLLAAELLARVYSITKEEKLLENAKKSLEFTQAYQNPDGSWYYGLARRQQYIDSFHTGFVLCSLYNLINYIDSTDNYRFRRILMKGYEYYKKTFFEDDGLPRYYNNKIYPIDLHCSAQ